MPTTTRFIIISKDALFCLHLKEGLKSFPTVELVIVVASLLEAENKIARNRSNVFLVDEDSVFFDSQLMQRIAGRFNNILVVTTAAKENAVKRRLQIGVTDFALKPKMFSKADTNRYLQTILRRMTGVVASHNVTVNYKDITKTVGVNDKIIAIAASTGGVEALEKILVELPEEIPPILLVQHMPSGFTKFFATRLDGKYPFSIKEAETGDFLMKNQMLIAPAGSHMQMVVTQNKLAVDCFLGPKMHGVIPAADILFESIANILKRNAVGVILTGMGADGARGLMLMHMQGAKTIGQNKESCVVYGMPKVAKDLGAIDYELPIDRIASKIVELI
ncbi:MAG: CheB methylesterase domain-containing protein [Firmicutes bacterium]|nr:CheB methylesterase domain-containing protein [Bacillota bacterium]